jgi:hypothetical protein
MTASDRAHMRVIIHLMQQSTVSFEAGDVWPRPAAGNASELESFADEVTRRLHSDGYIGYTSSPGTITVIPIGSVKRLDFTTVPPISPR